MNIDLYRYSLCIALTLMAFFVFRFFFGKVPDKRLFANYLLSRNLMGGGAFGAGGKLCCPSVL